MNSSLVAPFRRWRLTVLFAACAVASEAASGSTGTMPAPLPPLFLEGRAALGPAGEIRVGFPGVAVHLRFHGDALAVRARASAADVAWDVSLDGAEPVLLRLRAGEGVYPLVPPAAAADHTLVLTRRNESWQGTCDLQGFDLGPGGRWLEPPAPPARRLMFIGDSVTCGAMTAYDPAREMSAPLNSNARLAYGMILARRLGAQCHLVSYGGRGIIRDWQGLRDLANAPQFFERALPDDPASPWDHAGYVPDAIGIQLGTNDFNLGIPDQNEFVDAYVAFIGQVRRHAPEALVFVMDSPIVDNDAAKGPRRTALHFYLERVVARAASPRVILAPLPAYPGVPGNGHPSGREHEAMAALLEPLLRRALGW